MYKFVSISLIALLLTACGGGGGSSKKDPATAEQLAEGTTGAVIRALSYETAPDDVGNTALNPLNKSNNGIQSSLNMTSIAPAEVIEPIEEVGSCGGTVVVTGSFEESGSGEFDITFNDYCELDEQNFEYTLSGDAHTEFEVSEDTFSISMSMDLTFSSTDENFRSGTIKLSVSCSNGFDANTCSQSSNYDVDGAGEFGLSDFEVTGDSETGFNISGTVTDPSGATYNVEGEGIKFCTNGNLEQGTITIDDGNGEDIVITVDDCDTVTMSYQGEDQSYPQENS